VTTDIGAQTRVQPRSMKLFLPKKEATRLYQTGNNFVRNQHVDVDRNSNKSLSQILLRLEEY
jgi:hypothetical protein